MCVKFPLGEVNPSHFLPYSTSTYTCGVTIALRVCGDSIKKMLPINIVGADIAIGLC